MNVHDRRTASQVRSSTWVDRSSTGSGRSSRNCGPDAASGTNHTPFTVTLLGRELEGVMTTTTLYSRPTAAPAPGQTAKAGALDVFAKARSVPHCSGWRAEYLKRCRVDRHGHGRGLLRRLTWRDGPRRDLARVPAGDAYSAHGGGRQGWRGHLGDRASAGSRGGPIMPMRSWCTPW